MRTLKVITVALIFLAAACAVPFEDNVLEAEISRDESLRQMLPEAVPAGFALISYHKLRDDGGDLVGLESQYHKDSSIVTLCVSAPSGNPRGLGCVDGSPSQKVDRDSVSLTVAAYCSSEECATDLQAWLRNFGSSTPSANQAKLLLGTT